MKKGLLIGRGSNIVRGMVFLGSSKCVSALFTIYTFLSWD